MDLLLDEGALSRISRLRPRDCDYVALDVTDGRRLQLWLCSLSPVACLLAASVAGPELRQVLIVRLGGCDATRAVCNFLSGPWLPVGRVPLAGEPLVSWLEGIALGRPGEAVDHGKIPSRVTKLARLLLARAGAYPRRALLLAARGAYDGEYNAHEAVACALVAASAEGLAIAGELVASSRKSTSVRRTTTEVVRWAERAGYARPAPPGQSALGT